MTPREIVLFEPDAGGHQMHFVDLIAQAISKQGLAKIRLLTSQAAMRHESTRAALTRGVIEAVDFMAPGDVPPPWIYRAYGPARRQYSDTAVLARYLRARQSRVDLVFVPFLDSSCIIPLALSRYSLGKVPFAGITIRPSYHLRRVGVPAPVRLKNIPEAMIYRRLLARPGLAALFSIDPYFVRYIADGRVAYTPDPAELAGSPVPGALRRQLGLADESIVILLYGHIDSRKGFSQLIRAVAGVEDLPIVILAAGQQSAPLNLPEPETALLRKRRALVEVNRYISPEEEHALFLGADIVWVCYGNNYLSSSGAMIRAGMVGRPIITAKYGLSAQMARESGLGLAVDGDSLAEIAAAIRLLASDRARRARMGEAGKHFFLRHSAADFTAPVTEWLRRFFDGKMS